MTTEVLEAKFLELVAPRLGDAVAQRALAAVRSIEDRQDMRGAFE